MPGTLGQEGKVNDERRVFRLAQGFSVSSVIHTYMALKYSNKWYQSKDFLALRHKWYNKANRGSRYKDIEFTDWETGDSGNLLRGMSLADMERRWRPDKQRYYELARQHHWTLEERKPRPKRVHRRIWQLHSEGVSQANIATQLKVGRGTVAKVIRKEREIMLENC